MNLEGRPGYYLSCNFNGSCFSRERLVEFSAQRGPNDCLDASSGRAMVLTWAGNILTERDGKYFPLDEKAEVKGEGFVYCSNVGFSGAVAQVRIANNLAHEGTPFTVARDDIREVTRVEKTSKSS